MTMGTQGYSRISVNKENNMKAVIFAAGEGTRMLPLTLETPKPMLMVLGKPLLQRTIELLPENVDEVVVVVGYKREQIIAHFGAEYEGKRMTYVVQEKLGGTAEALMLAKEHLMDTAFFSFYADDIYDKGDVLKLLDHQYGVLVAEVADPRAFGVIELGADGKIISFEEKPEHPKSNLVSTGAFLLDPAIFNYTAEPHPKTGERYLTDMVMGLAKDRDFYGVITKRWIPIGYPADLVTAETYAQKH